MTPDRAGDNDSEALKTWLSQIYDTTPDMQTAQGAALTIRVQEAVFRLVIGFEVNQLPNNDQDH